MAPVHALALVGCQPARAHSTAVAPHSTARRRRRSSLQVRAAKKRTAKSWQYLTSLFAFHHSSLPSPRAHSRSKPLCKAWPADAFLPFPCLAPPAVIEQSSRLPFCHHAENPPAIVTFSTRQLALVLQFPPCHCKSRNPQTETQEIGPGTFPRTTSADQQHSPRLEWKSPQRQDARTPGHFALGLHALPAPRGIKTGVPVQDGSQGGRCGGRP